MRRFAKLITTLDETTKINPKVAALAKYFEEAPGSDSVWTIALLSHRRPRRTVNTTQLRIWAAKYSNIPLWLFEESYHIVGDLAETIALVAPEPSIRHDKSLTYWINYIRDLKDREDLEKEKAIVQAWRGMDKSERFVFNKLITGGWRIGVSQKLMIRALHKYTGIDQNILAHRLMGKWTPDDVSFDELVKSESENERQSRPYPFYLTYALEDGVQALGDANAWSAEYKWDGIRGQLIKREGELFVWSRGEELVTDKYPEYAELAPYLPDGIVIDGEILPFRDGRPLSFNELQRRIGRKRVGKKLLKEVPVVLMAYDLLEHEGRDIRNKPFKDRRRLLEKLVEDTAQPNLRLSPLITFTAWKQLEDVRAGARGELAEGVMLKKWDSPYKVGRKKGDWWKWKLDPLTVDAVMIYAQRGHGRRANLYTDFTFAVWDGADLITFTKAYSGLTDAEFREVNQFIRRNTIDRFGPVRAVRPALVFEIAFEGIRASRRHKSGIALRFPRINRWRKDKKASEANTLEDLKQLLTIYEGAAGE